MGKSHQRTALEDARDRLFAEIHRCGVPGASEEDVQIWLEDTVEYLADEFPMLSPAQIGQLKLMGQNYVAPAIPHGAGKNATNRDEWEPESDRVMASLA